jgi:transposase
MPTCPIKRPVVRLDTSNQLGLFPVTAPEAAEPISPVSKRVYFIEPDPSEIRLGGKGLYEHLKQVGERDAFVVRQLLLEEDWTAFESAYRPGGRRPYSPRALLGLILYGVMQGKTSLRDLERLARIDLGSMWVSGGIHPDHSSIGRFIQCHEALLSEAFFMALTQRVLKVTQSDSQVVAGDGTVIEAAASRYRLLKAEAVQQVAEQARCAADAQPHDTGLSERAQQAEAVAHTFDSRKQAREAHGKRADGLQISPTEPEAVIQRQKDKQRFAASYKPSILANAVRVIVAQDLDASSETAVVPGLLDQAQQHGPVSTALFDAGYHTEGVIEATEKRTIELLCPEGQSRGEQWIKQSQKQYPKNRFCYDLASDCYRCPQGERLSRVSVCQGTERYAGYVLYGTAACDGCAQRARCTRNKQGRRIKRYACDAAKEALRAHMEEPDVRQRYIQRQAMVEPVFSVLRLRQGLNRFRRRGLKAVRCEFALHAMAYNLSRAVALGQALWAFLVRCAGYRSRVRIFLAGVRSIANYFSLPVSRLAACV